VGQAGVVLPGVVAVGGHHGRQAAAQPARQEEGGDGEEEAAEQAREAALRLELDAPLREAVTGGGEAEVEADEEEREGPGDGDREGAAIEAELELGLGVDAGGEAGPRPESLLGSFLGDVSVEEDAAAVAVEGMALEPRIHEAAARSRFEAEFAQENGGGELGGADEARACAVGVEVERAVVELGLEAANGERREAAGAGEGEAAAEVGGEVVAIEGEP
jgi:hypothetical protein